MKISQGKQTKQSNSPLQIKSFVTSISTTMDY